MCLGIDDAWYTLPTILTYISIHPECPRAVRRGQYRVSRQQRQQDTFSSGQFRARLNKTVRKTYIQACVKA